MALQQTGSMQPKTSEKSQFEIALTDKRIAQAPEETLREALRYCMVKIGLRGKNFPTGPEKILLLNHIVSNYGNHTPSEIRLAFDLALAAKLDLDTEDIRCYENFSCAYFSTIMNAYRIWAAQAHVQLQKQPLIENKPDLEQIEKEWQEFLQTDLGKKLNPKI